MPRESRLIELSGMRFWADTYSMKITSNECLTRVRSLLSCRSSMNVARSFRGKEAQSFVNFLDQVLAQSSLDNKSRQRGLLLLSKICKSRGIIPASYLIQRKSVHFGKVRCRGGFADVSDGEYLGSPVAIKHLKMNGGDSDGPFKRLCREIIGWKHLSHPNILPLLGVSVSVDPRCFHILTEWMPNGNIIQYARSNPKANRLQLLSEVMSGVVYLHELKIVHGDLKGANVLVDGTGAARVADFGLMTMADLNTILLSESITPCGGTFCWMSPELLDPPIGSDGCPTCESDCYALGMVIYEVLTGVRPFHRLCGLRSVPAVLRGERPEKPLDSESIGFSRTLWGLVRLCWSESSSARPTARRLLDYLSPASLTWVPPPVYPVVATNVDSDSSSSLGSDSPCDVWNW